QLERVLERLLGVLEPTLAVIDHAEHVVEIGEARPLRCRFGEERLGLLVLAGVVVLASERDQLIDRIGHPRTGTIPCFGAAGRADARLGSAARASPARSDFGYLVTSSVHAPRARSGMSTATYARPSSHSASSS